MKFIKKNFYFISIGVLALFTAFLLLFRKNTSDIPPIHNRIGAMAAGAEWMNAKQVMEGYIEKIKENPNDNTSKIRLAEAYFQEGRVTGDHTYYDAAALKLIDEVLQKDPNNFEALINQASIYLSQHHFADGLKVGKLAQKQAPFSSLVYGILTDSYVELGKYDSATQMADTMCGIRPDLRSYSRISYVREIYGNIPGAIAAMKMAVEAGAPGLEETEWCRYNLGKLYEQLGHLDSAEYQYKVALVERPDYAYALAGMGRIERARKNYDRAIAYFKKADQNVQDYSFGDELIDLYRLTGQNEKADSVAKAVIANLQAQANSNESNQYAGHYTDKELAYVYLKTGDKDNALKHAQIEYNRRPDNIDVNELMAWVYYQQGAYDQAVPYIEKALRTGVQNPTTLCRAGLIYCKNNQTDKGLGLIQKAVNENPYLEEDLMKEAIAYLQNSNPGAFTAAKL